MSAVVLEKASASIGFVSICVNLILVRYVRKQDIVLRLILLSLICDVIVALTTVITASERLIQEEGPTKNSGLFYFSLVPISIFGDCLEAIFSFNFAFDRFLNFATPTNYPLISTICPSMLLFGCITVACFFCSMLITFEVQKISDFEGYNGTIASFLREDMFNVYFGALFWIAAMTFMLSGVTICLVSARYNHKINWEDLKNNSYFLFPNTLLSVIRSCAILFSYFGSYSLITDKAELLPTSRLISMGILLIFQPATVILSFRWNKRRQASKNLKPKMKLTVKNCNEFGLALIGLFSATAAAVISPALMIDATALSIWSIPVMNFNLNSREFMEERANRERSVSFYQIVRHNRNILMPETPFGDFSDPFA